MKRNATYGTTEPCDVNKMIRRLPLNSFIVKRNGFAVMPTLSAWRKQADLVVSATAPPSDSVKVKNAPHPACGHLLPEGEGTIINTAKSNRYIDGFPLLPEGEGARQGG